MESSQIFGFFKILIESTRIFFKNAKLLAPITALSLLLTSIIFLLFTFSHQCATAYMNNSFTDSTSGVPFLQFAIYLALILAVDIAFMISCIAVLHVSGVATVILAATSLADAKLSLRDLCTRTGAKSRIPFRKNLRRGSASPLLLLSIAAATAAIVAVILFPYYLTIAVIVVVSVVGVSVFVYLLYASVASGLAAVIPVVEDGCEAAEAAEKAEKLVEGQRLQGFMVNLFINALCLIAMWSFWMVVGDRGSLNTTVYGLFFMNCATASCLFVGIMYTVYYFQCKEYHGEKVELFGNFHYTTLKNDIP